MEQNDKFLQSLQGRLNIFKTTFEELARDTLNSETFKSFIDSGTGALRFLISLEDSIGIVNALLLISLPKSISITTSAIQKMTTSTTALMGATGAFTIAITAIIGTLVLLETHTRKVTQELKEQKTELDGTIESWSRLNEEQKQLAKQEAQATLNRLAPEIENAREVVDSYTIKLEALNIEMNQLKSEARHGSNSMKNYANAIKNKQKEIDRANASMAKYVATVEAYDSALIVSNELEIQSGEISKESIETSKALGKSWKMQKEQLEDNSSSSDTLAESYESLDDQIKRLTENYEFMSDVSKKATKAQIQSYIDDSKALKEKVLINIELMEKEYNARLRLVMLGEQTFTAEEINLLESYGKSITAYKEEVESLIIRENKLIKSRDDLDKNTKKAKTAIELLEEELRKLSIQEDLASGDMSKQNELREQQIEVLEKLKSKVKEGSLEWNQYQLAIKNVNKEMQDELKQSISDVNDQLEKHNDLLEKEAETLQNEIKNALQSEINLLDSKKSALEDELDLMQKRRKEQEDEEKRLAKLKSLEEARLKLRNIEANKNVRVFRAGQGFVFEADPRAVKAQREEIAKLEEDIRKDDVDRARDAEEDKLKDRIKALDKQKNAVKNTMSQISNITSAELSKQESLWKSWESKNSGVLASFRNNIAKTITDINKLNQQRIATEAQIKENQSSPTTPTIEYEGVGKTVADAIANPDTPDDVRRRAQEWLDKFGHRYIKNSYATGGVIANDQVAQLHGNEVVLNSRQISNVGSGLGMQMSSAMQNARNLFSFANRPSIAMAGQGSVSSGTTIQNMTVELPNVTDVQTFASEIQNIKRYFNNRS